MPLYVIPIYCTVDVPNAAEAESSQRAIDKLLNGGMAPIILGGAGVKYTGIIVGTPVLATTPPKR
jgi:hypothetical protein